MKVYKFGGASVKDAEGIRNVLRIVSREKGDLIIVVSAMGKTTNALERVVNARWENCEDVALSEYAAIRNQHQAIAKELGLSQTVQQALFATNLVSDIPLVDNYDLFYDQIVCTGELNSSRLLSAYLNANGVENELLMMPQSLITDTTYREAKVNMTVSAENVRQAIGQSKAHVFVTQGFIGGTPDKHFTTLGREGSDYSAALLANFIDAESATIWKDVPGILNADPRLVENTILIPELSYSEAVELAYSGAQVIHPKSIRPVENKKIPLYVRPFNAPDEAGSVICEINKRVNVPVYIWRKNQLLITMKAKDFSFILEESLSAIFDIINRHRLKVSLIQSSAVTISVCVDNTRYVPDAIKELSKAFAVTYNDGLSLLTIRGTSPEILAREQANREILLTQTTRRTARIVVKEG